MKILLCVVLVILCVFSFTTTMAAQNDTVYIHGGSAEALVNGCAIVERMDVEKSTVPSKDIKGLSYCFGYILGVVDMHNSLNALLPSPKDNTYCVPDNASVTQLAKVVVKYGNEHPEELHEAAVLIVSNAFIKNFLCK